MAKMSKTFRQGAALLRQDIANLCLQFPELIEDETLWLDTNSHPARHREHQGGDCRHQSAG
jgi:hypothetical protein